MTKTRTRVPIEVRLPEIGETITSAKLVAWLKREGDAITAGEPIAEVETEKTNVEVEAPGSGVLGTIYVPAGTDGVQVGTLLAVIVPEASHVDLSQPPAHTNSENTIPKEIPIILAPAAIQSEEPTTRPSPEPIAATPLAIRMAILADLDLSMIRATATGDRITKADVEAAIKNRGSAGGVPGTVTGSERLVTSAAPLTPAADRATGMVFEDRPLSPMRRVTAGRMQLAKQIIPHFYLHVDCVVDALIARRAEINAGQHGVNITITDFIILAVALALRKVPLANSAWMETAVRVYDSVDIAVAVDTPKGLITPIVLACHLKSLAAISLELKRLVERARDGSLMPREYTGGTFTISNLGMFGVSGVIPIINPPQSCILGVGAIEQRPIVRDGQVAVGSVMTCTLAADHRAVDGATGAELLTEVRRLIEDPVSMGEGIGRQDL